MRFTIMLFVAGLFLSLSSCSNHGKLFEQWKELGSYHDLMSQAFHSSEDGDLGPVKELSSDMVTRATTLTEAEIPTAFDSEEMKKTLQNLKSETVALDLMIKEKASDEEVTKALSALHDVFHSVMKLSSQ